MISTENKRQIVALSHLALPNEACGFVVDDEVVQCENIHESPTTNFRIAAEDYIAAEEKGTIRAVFHSHGPDHQPRFSSHDVRACKQSAIPWVLYHTKTGSFVWADPSGNMPYLERQWVYGINDCYGLVRDFYRREFDIVLDNFERGDEYEWESRDWQMFGKNYLDQGFSPVEKPTQKGDILLMQIGAPFPNHVGVMSGDGMLFYHHLMDRLSEASVWGGFWASSCCQVLRHHLL